VERGNRVAIVDTDIQSPGIHAIFGLDPESVQRTLNDYLWEQCSIVDAAHDVTSALRRGGNGDVGGKLHLVPSSIKAHEIARILRQGINVQRLRDSFRELSTSLNLDYLFIDTHPGLNEETLLSIAISDMLVLILRPDRQDYQGTAVTVDVANRLKVPKMLLVANKVPSVLDPNGLKEQLESAYRTTVAGLLPSSDDLMVLASSGVFSVSFPDHPWTKEMRSIADQIGAG
jgi:MinD-like ATPase involved in chromosome partitioning or flagellar assembly